MIFLNGPRWVFFRKSSFYHSKTIVREDSGLQESMQIKKNECENRVRKMYAELNEHGAKMQPESKPEIINISKTY